MIWFWSYLMIKIWILTDIKDDVVKDSVVKTESTTDEFIKED